MALKRTAKNRPSTTFRLTSSTFSVNLRTTRTGGDKASFRLFFFRSFILTGLCTGVPAPVSQGKCKDSTGAIVPDAQTHRGHRRSTSNTASKKLSNSLAIPGAVTGAWPRYTVRPKRPASRNRCARASLWGRRSHCAGLRPRSGSNQPER